jgi:hypothetical protein
LQRVPRLLRQFPERDVGHSTDAKNLTRPCRF